jgi:hypothetical protein
MNKQQSEHMYATCLCVDRFGVRPLMASQAEAKACELLSGMKKCSRIYLAIQFGKVTFRWSFTETSPKQKLSFNFFSRACGHKSVTDLLVMALIQKEKAILKILEWECVLSNVPNTRGIEHSKCTRNAELSTPCQGVSLMQPRTRPAIPMDSSDSHRKWSQWNF